MIDKSTLEQARNTDIIAFFEQRCGFTFAQVGGAYRCKEHKSLAVKADRRSWYWHSKGVGGFGVLDYLIKVDGMLFRDAVAIVGRITLPASTLAAAQEQPRTLVLPKRATMPLRLYDYLCVKRGINSEVVMTLIQKEMLYEDRRGNIVFLGYDERSKPRFASLRGTYADFRGDCAGSDKRYGFAMAFSQSERLYVFESPIDAMSHASLDVSAWQEHNRLSLAGTSDTALTFFLNKHNYTKALVFCLDNDPAGREASAHLARKYADRGYHTRVELPQGKDFNDDLMAMSREKSPHQRRTVAQSID